jgi:hypothetical protein
VWPGRRTLYASEVADALSITPRQVVDLIVCGDLVAINISAQRETKIVALSSEEMTAEERRRVPRTHWRVPVSAFDAFIAARASTNADAV